MAQLGANARQSARAPTYIGALGVSVSGGVGGLVRAKWAGVRYLQERG